MVVYEIVYLVLGSCVWFMMIANEIVYRVSGVWLLDGCAVSMCLLHDYSYSAIDGNKLVLDDQR